MTDKKISALTAATTPLTGTEVVPIVQSGATVKVAVSDLTAGRAVSGLSFSATQALIPNGLYGVQNDTFYVGVRNPIWCFNTATAYGISYFQGTSGIGGTASDDTIGTNSGDDHRHHCRAKHHHGLAVRPILWWSCKRYYWQHNEPIRRAFVPSGKWDGLLTRQCRLGQQLVRFWIVFHSELNHERHHRNPTPTLVQQDLQSRSDLVPADAARSKRQLGRAVLAA